ncbi:uncharacterized protein LOC114797369 [Denticeps clupeoides]|uniref:uncharacterized protein LOC114797369 n=1 Tax=Denticeps clupeoides TaxID=299321 RepID=UPI0010A421A4|nr:uncharacterized protein LOC114797369 [Denticeps clupeoides]
MGGEISLQNQTPYTWYYYDEGGYNRLRRGEKATFGGKHALRVKYEDHSDDDFYCNDTSFWTGSGGFVLKETSDRSRVELRSEDHVHSCPNYGKIEDDRRQEEQERQKERREREQREKEQREREQQEKERREREQQEKARREWEQQQRERREREQQEKARRAWEQQQRERREREQQEKARREWEQQQRERREREQQEKARREWEQQQRERREREQQEKARRAWEQKQRERREREQQEKEWREREQREKEQREREQQEKARRAWEQKQRERREREQQEKEWREREQREKEQREREQQEKAKREWAQQEKARREFEQLEREQQQREEFKRLMRERLEQLRREKEQLQLELIKNKIKKENEDSWRKLSQAHETFEQNLSAQQLYHNPIQELQQVMKCDAITMENVEVQDVECKFKAILVENQITEDETMQHCNLEDRIKTLHNEMVLQFFGSHDLPCQLFTLDKAIGYADLSLTERVIVLEALVQLSVEGDIEDLFSCGQDQKNVFLLNLIEMLYATHPTLAANVLLSVVDFLADASSKEILNQMLFNNTWTPSEIMLFINKAGASAHNRKIREILQMVQTYRLSCLVAISALDKRDPVKYLQSLAECAQDKDANTLLAEMGQADYPEETLELLDDVLHYIEETLPTCVDTDFSQKKLLQLKCNICSLDLSNPNIDVLKEILIWMCLAVRDCTAFTTKTKKKVHGYLPRLTQLASLSLLLLPQLTGGKGCLLEIGTGEGKTCILAMFAAIQAIRGTKVDIVTSSPVLAIRDQEQWQKLYAMFGLTSSVVPPTMKKGSSPEKVVEEAYSKDIVYGTVCTFAADALKQEFERETTRGNRTFDLVIVDEVDYMTLDNGVQITFLSHQSSSLRHVEQVLAGIWAIMSSCRPIEMFHSGEVHWTTRPQHFHQTLMSMVEVSKSAEFSAFDILKLGVKPGICSKEDLERLKQAECDEQEEHANEDFQSAQWKVIEEIMSKIGPNEQFKLVTELERTKSVKVECFLVEENKAKPCKMQTEQSVTGKLLLLENGCACEIMTEEDLITSAVNKLKTKIKISSKLSPDSLEAAKNFIVVPAFLQEYVEKQLPVFVENALRAILMTQGREYMIDTTAEGEDQDKDCHYYDVLIPVDFKSSGILEKNKRWGDGLQQFLEMKHQLAISQLTNVTNYMSNVHFFKRYLKAKGIFGVSGTLGGQADKRFLERHYKTKCYEVPTHRHKKVIELPTVQVHGGHTHWTGKICETAWKVADRGQVVLIICEDVKTANELQIKMQDNKEHSNPITMYTISGKHDIENQTFGPGNVIIATNLGGRGTDIHVHSDANKSGGLFVILTYFPNSRRVEKQVFGRTGRKGDPGMVQMIINHEQLCPSYQGQPIEIMRDLREHHEVRCIEDMESDELLVIADKENLFVVFCTFLSEFEKNYKEEERRDNKGLKLQDIPKCFRGNFNKFDYRPAINALKESWAMWLILHEEQIREHSNGHGLVEDLSMELQKASHMLLQGKSQNLYDHIKQAMGRTDLHCRKKTDLDYGAKSFWQSAAKCDHFYSAVALYNQAFVTINLGRNGYISEAMQLLEKANKLVDVFLAEATNTLFFGNMAVTSDFQPHHKCSNFQLQLQARINIFKSWKDSINSAIKKLDHIKSAGDDALTEDTSVYSLAKVTDHITTNELMSLYEYGLGIVFDVKKKPKFSVDALVCFSLGVLQVCAGILVCAVSYGSASHIGLNLICEGVSDMISGVRGMIQGGFDWAEWAISKSISIGLFLLSGGFGMLKKSVQGVKNIAAGTKSLSFMAVKQVAKQAGKYAIQEVGKQTALAVFNYAADRGLQALFKRILQDQFKQKVFSMVKNNRELDVALTHYICQGVPKSALQVEDSDFKIDWLCEDKMERAVEDMTRQVVPDLMMDCTTVRKVLDRLSEVCSKASGFLEKHRMSGVGRAAGHILNASQYIVTFKQIMDSIPTEEVIKTKFIPGFLKNVNYLLQERYDEDGRHKLQDVKRLKIKLLNSIAESVSESFVDACSAHLGDLASREVSKITSRRIGTCVSNVMGRYKTQRFFDDQRHNYKMKKASGKAEEPQSRAEQAVLMQYAEGLGDSGKPATVLDLHVLTRSSLLEGKGIRIIVTDKDGKILSEERYRGTDESAGEITLRLTKEREMQKKEDVLTVLSKRIRGEENPYTGHFDILRPDGRVVRVDSKGQNCLYHAIVQATSRGQTQDLHEEARRLRTHVKNEVQQKLPQYAPMLKLQKGYEVFFAQPGKYTITGGDKKSRDQALKEYLENLNSNTNLPEGSTIKTYRLGLVANYNDLISARKCNKNEVNADHIPAKDTYKRARKMIEDNPHLAKQLKKNHPEIHALLERSKSDNNGRHLLCMEVLTEHHKQALTTYNSQESQQIRDLVGKSLVEGNGEKMIKLSFLAAHPESSQQLRADAGKRHSPRSGIQLNPNDYYKMGFQQITRNYCTMGIINQNQRDGILQWLNEDQHLRRDTAEYRELRNAIGQKGRPVHEMQNAKRI